MKKKNILLAVLAAVLVLTAVPRAAWAYFTTYTEAKGGYTIELGDQTRVTEEFSAWTKHVVITSAEDSEPVYVRAKAFCGSEYTLTYSDESGKWTPGSDGYYYYSDIVYGGESTEELLVLIGNVPQDVTDTASFNVVVIYETTPVQYDAQGNPFADWSILLDTGQGKGGAER